MYEQIASNKRKSYALVAVFVVLIGLLGYVFGLFTGSIIAGLFIAGLFSVVMILISYYAGDSIILAANKAREAKKSEFPYLYNTVEGLAIAAGLPKPKIYVIDSPALNAFATGRDPRHASITVTTGLLEKMNRQELEGVIGHEMSHVKNFDIRLMLFVVVLASMAVLLSDMIIRSSFFGRRDSERDGGLGTVFLIVGLVLAILTPIIAQLIKLAISRKREYLADADGALLTRYPKGLADALRKIAKDTNTLETANAASANIYISNPFRKGWVAGLFSTHPPIEKRIKALEAM